MEQENEFAEKRFETYLGLYGGILGKVNSSEVALGILQECARDRRMEEIRRERQRANGNGNGAATERQIAFLRDLGCEIPSGLTKREASELIDQNIGKEE